MHGSLKGGWEGGDRSLCVQTHLGAASGPGKELHHLSISPAPLTPWQPERTGTPKGFELGEDMGFWHFAAFFPTETINEQWWDRDPMQQPPPAPSQPNVQIQRDWKQR